MNICIFQNINFLHKVEMFVMMLANHIQKEY